jgi:hypothetical protein
MQLIPADKLIKIPYLESIKNIKLWIEVVFVTCLIVSMEHFENGCYLKQEAQENGMTHMTKITAINDH